MKKQSQKEYDTILKSLSRQTASTLSIPYAEAKKRVQGLLSSGILNSGGPEDIDKQIMIDTFLQIPSKEYEHLNQGK